MERDQGSDNLSVTTAGIDRGFNNIPVTIVEMDSSYMPGPVAPGSIDCDAYRTYVESTHPRGDIEKARQELQNNPARVVLDQIADLNI